MSAQGRRTRGNPPGRATGQRRVIVKTAIQTAPQSDTTLRDDNHFQFKLPGGTVWFGEMNLIVVAASTAADIKTTWSMSASGQFEYSRTFAGVTSTSPPTLLTNGNIAFGLDNGRTPITIKTWFYPSVGDTLVKFQWSQAQSVAENVSIDKYSWMELQRLRYAP